MASQVSVAEVTKHATPEDCWIVVNNKVYDLTAFAPNHPGGSSFIYKYAGKDGTKTYNEYHSSQLIEKTLSASEKKGEFDSSTITSTWTDAQKEAPVSAPDPNERPPLSAIINLNDFEVAFNSSGPPKANAYISGASNDLLTLNANKASWQKLWFRPRIMRNVSVVNTKTTLLGCDVFMPVWICPMGIAKTAGPEGEMALARGAASSGIIHCVSTTASYGVEDIIAAAPKTYPFFFQLYVDKQRSKTEALLKQLEGMSQVKALFVTVDLAVVSKREADERIRTQETTTVYLGGAKNSVDKKGAGLARTTGSFIDWALNWDDVAWIRARSSLPIVIKGVQSAADARMALSMGCQGIVVSNHGGRALDNAPATLLVLLELRRDCPEVFDRMEVMVDGGVRRGSDVLKAIMLGARGVGVGRPFQCSVLYDTEGVETAAASKFADLCSSLRDVDWVLTYGTSPAGRAGDRNAVVRCHGPGEGQRGPVVPQHQRARALASEAAAVRMVLGATGDVVRVVVHVCIQYILPCLTHLYPLRCIYQVDCSSFTQAAVHFVYGSIGVFLDPDSTLRMLLVHPARCTKHTQSRKLLSKLPLQRCCVHSGTLRNTYRQDGCRCHRSSQRERSSTGESRPASLARNREQPDCGYDEITMRKIVSLYACVTRPLAAGRRLPTRYASHGVTCSSAYRNAAW